MGLTYDDMIDWAFEDSGVVIEEGMNFDEWFAMVEGEWNPNNRFDLMELPDSLIQQMQDRYDAQS